MSLCAFQYPDTGEYAEVWRERVVRARTEHACCECGAVIQPGERYGRATGIFKGVGPVDFHRCPACLILAELVATLTEYCPLWNGLDLAISDYTRGELPSPREHRQRWEAAGSPPPPPPTQEATA